MRPPDDLLALQTWMQDALLPADPAPPAQDADAWIERSETLEADDRLAIYRRMIGVRLEDALAGLYPTVRDTLGSTAFSKLASMYFRAHPSRSFTLAGVGAGLRSFLSTWNGVQEKERAALLDAARLDGARHEVAKARPARAVDPELLGHLDEAQWEAGRLQPAPRARRLRLLRGADIILFRGPHGVREYPVEESAIPLLDALLEGESLARALEREVAREDGPSASAWLEAWFETGLFVGIDVSSS